MSEPASRRETSRPADPVRPASSATVTLEYVSPDDRRFRDWLRRYREEVAGEAPTDEWLDAYLKHIFSEQGRHRHIWWGVADGRRVGFAVAIVTPQVADRHRLQGMIAEFYVYPEYRREGYGRRMAEAVIAFLRERGCQDVHASVSAGNLRGLRFWEACSFQISRYVLVYRPGLRREDEDEEEL
ncbi:MAG: GNAT family N-acetyltransferase [Armatimonadota bacterium]|nr:GNAT family N-acetyltransferase [Armatimonadota bacterium]MDR7401587.1 GNAT family N-acetyltransferase [Armatimonadota bacterium]MDR7403328.1 GNAT family N-acetyltransferase [Armatimonadota bacterium]MDR7436854.1 GNAT family N-acetyltransferase [Armatimonadota bacterium]MDR7471605.1 GNAT family N-acetyltransferase [Armatimonadota bacterium]